tara:strand:- start:1759 stop:2649 length:891 start_codon:yes stop_codon:yes gene_type:complete
MSGGGGSGSDGGNDMEVSGMEAAVSTEKGISNYSDTRTSSSSYNDSSNTGSGNRPNPHTDSGTSRSDLTLGPDRSTIGMASDLGMSQTQLDRATAKNIVDLVDSGVNVNDAISGKTSMERILQSKTPFMSVNVLKEVLSPFANAANTKRRSNWIEGTDKFGMPRTRDFYIQHKRAYNPNAVLVKGSPEYEFLEDSGYFQSLGNDNNTTGDNDNFYDVPEDVKLVENTAANRIDSVAAKFFGKSADKFKFDFQTEYTKALANQKALLNKPSAVGLLAVNQSPFYNWLKDNSLDKGIL